MKSEVKERNMKKNQEIKATQVEMIKENLEKAQSVVFVDYRGLTVEEDTALRKKLREAGVTYKVLKNTLIKRAASELSIEGLDDHLNGPTAVAFGITDPAAPAKIIGEFIQQSKKMEIKCGLVDKKYIDVKGVEALAELPSKEVLVARLLGSMNAPISGLVTVLGGTLRSLLYAINAVKEQKENAA